jgi:hypothetical protein
MPNSQVKKIFDKVITDIKIAKFRLTNIITHVAVIVSRGKIIAEATNRIGFRSRESRSYSNTYVHPEKNIHAERNVIKALGSYSKLKNADMYILKFGRGEARDEFINSKPCARCECYLKKCIKQYGLRNIYYSSSLSSPPYLHSPPP